MKDYRYKARGVGDLLNYGMMLDDGILLLKDGAFCAGWEVFGPDTYSVDKDTILIIRQTLNATLIQLGDGWMLHSNLIRKEVQEYIDPAKNYFPDATSFYLDKKRSEYFLSKDRHFDSSHIFILTYKPPIELESKFQKFFVEKNDNNISNWNNVLASFKNKILQIGNSLSKNLDLKKLSTQELLSHLHASITGLLHPIHVPDFPIYLDQFLASQDFLGGFEPKMGDKHIAIIGMSGFPLASTPCMLQHLSELPVAFRWSNRFIFMDAITGISQTKKHRRYWFQKRQGITGLVKEIFNISSAGFVDQDALEMANDADNAIQEIESNLIRNGYYTSTFVLMDEDRAKLKESIKLLTKELEKKGFATRVERVNAVEAFIGSLPGHGYQNIRKPIVSTINFGDFLPLLSVLKGQEHHPCPYYPSQSPPLFYAQTEGKTPFSASLHYDDVGHTLVIGDTGSGKSTLLGFIITQHLRYPHAQVFMFDKGYSSFTLCHALEGSHYDIAQDAISFAPLQDIKNETEIDWVCEWLEIVFQSQGINLSPIKRNEIRQSLLSLKMSDSPTLTDLQASIQDKELKMALEFYTLSGTMGQLLDAEKDAITTDSLQIFEMQHLLNKEEKFAIPVLDYLFHQINKRLDVNKPSLIIIEEGHRFLKGHFGSQLEVWLRECRKQNAAVIFVTQSLSEIVSSNLKHILLNSCPTRLFLPNPHANAPYNKELYYQLGLTDKQIDIIQQSVPKQDYYLVSPLGNRLMNLVLSKIFLMLMESTNTEERKHILNLKETYQRQWIYHYLLDKGLEVEAEEWLQIFTKQFTT